MVSRIPADRAAASVAFDFIGHAFELSEHLLQRAHHSSRVRRRGRRITPSPSRSTVTSSVSKRNSLGRRTAWLRPFMKTLAVAISDMVGTVS